MRIMDKMAVGDVYRQRAVGRMTRRAVGNALADQTNARRFTVKKIDLGAGRVGMMTSDGKYEWWPILLCECSLIKVKAVSS